MPHHVKQAGFNLLEVLVASMLLGVVIAISLQTSAGDIAVYRRTADTTFARWVALNQIAAVQLANQTTFPATGKQSGEAEMGGTRWRWQQEIQESGNGDMRRIQVLVSHPDKPDDPVDQQVGYVANPKPQPRKVASP